MTSDKVKEIIDLENSRKEQRMVNDARNIIEEIGEHQEAITSHKLAIEKLKASLLALETTPIDPADILN